MSNMLYDMINRRNYTISAACGCYIGKVRKNNEDNFVFDGKSLERVNRGLKNVVTMEAKLDSPKCFAVFDGIGGEAHGEEASFCAADAFKQETRRLEEYYFQPREFLKRVCDKMNMEIWTASQKYMDCNMGSTAVMLYMHNRKIYMGNVGDSKAFRLRENEWMQLSQDHTDEKYIIEYGIIGRKPSLLQYLGMDPEDIMIEPYVAKGDIKRGDYYLLCSDGLTEMLSNIDICGTIKDSENVEIAVERLLSSAMNNGGKDNITVILIYVSNSTITRCRNG